MITIAFLFIGLYAIMIILFTVGFIRLQKTNLTGVDNPRIFVSVIIPARNESESLPALLEALNHQEGVNGLFEVIIVDDYSEDETINVVKSTTLSYPLTVFSLKDNGQPAGKKSAISFGVKHAKHPVILLTDADCIPEGGWISSHSRLFSKESCHMTAGLIRYDTTWKSPAAIEALDFYGMVASSAGAAGTGIPFMCNAANLAFLRKSFEDINGFSHHSEISSGDDVFLLHQFINRFGKDSVNWNLEYGSIVNTTGSGGINSFFRQRLRWASKGKYYTNKTAIGVSFLVLLTNFFVAAGIVIAIFQGKAVISILILLLKMLIDLPLMALITKRFRQTALLVWFIPATIIYPFYTAITGLMSLIFRPGWKGRRIRL